MDNIRIRVSTDPVTFLRKSYHDELTTGSILLNGLKHDSKFNVTLEIMDSNNNNLTDSVLISGQTLNPVLVLNKPKIGHDEVELSWTTNHPDIRTQKTIR